MKKYIENSVLLRFFGQSESQVLQWTPHLPSALPIFLSASWDPLSAQGYLLLPTAGLGSPSPLLTLISNLILAVLCLYPLWKLSASSASRTTALIQVFVTSDWVATEVTLSPCLQLCSTPGHSQWHQWNKMKVPKPYFIYIYTHTYIIKVEYN